MFLVLQKATGAEGRGRVDRIRTLVNVLDHPILVDHKRDSIGK